MKLHPQDAAALVLSDTSPSGQVFLLRGGDSVTRSKWSQQVKETLLIAHDELSILEFTIASPGRLRASVGHLVTTMLSGSPDVVILNGSNLNKKEELAGRGIATTLGFQFVVVDHFLTPDERLTFGWPEIIPVTPSNTHLPQAIIVDLDGTLADSSHRPHYGPSEAQILADKVIPHVARIVNMFYDHFHIVIFVTARGETEGELQATSQWITYHLGLLPNVDERAFLFSRNVGDGRRDSEVKLEIFNEHIRGKYNVELVLDDRPAVCRMWQELGLPVLANQAYTRGEF